MMRRFNFFVKVDLSSIRLRKEGMMEKRKGGKGINRKKKETDGKDRGGREKKGKRGKGKQKEIWQRKRQ
jgi:hypothetical protein